MTKSNSTKAISRISRGLSQMTGQELLKFTKVPYPGDRRNIGGRNSVRGRNSEDGISEKKFRETSRELGGWSEDRRKGL